MLLLSPLLLLSLLLIFPMPQTTTQALPQQSQAGYSLRPLH
jgi:hypothetical protein